MRMPEKPDKANISIKILQAFELVLTSTPIDGALTPLKKLILSRVIDSMSGVDREMLTESGKIYTKNKTNEAKKDFLSKFSQSVNNTDKVDRLSKDESWAKIKPDLTKTLNALKKAAGIDEKAGKDKPIKP